MFEGNDRLVSTRCNTTEASRFEWQCVYTILDLVTYLVAQCEHAPDVSLSLQLLSATGVVLADGGGQPHEARQLVAMYNCAEAAQGCSEAARQSAPPPPGS